MADHYINHQPVRRYTSVDDEIFQGIVKRGEPAIIEGSDFGDCLTKWSLDYLNSKLKDESIVIHESDQVDLSFIRKNFRYVTCKFSEFSRKLSTLDTNTGSNVYLRSTNKNPRSKRAARIEDDFPVLANDLRPPKYIPYGSESELYHSSILRIASAKLQIWTHFDLYDNILVQVVGSKRIVFFPPEDTRCLYVEGDKSHVNDLDNWEKCIVDYPLVADTRPQSCLLEPGQALFIPSLWWHNIRTVTCEQTRTTTTTTNYSIGFNIFWKDQALVSQQCLYADNDVYGNKNPIPYELALTNVNKIVQHLNRLPGKYNTFYKLMLLDRLKRELFPAQQDDG